MPVDDRGIGTGKFTDLKFEHFEKIIDFHISITNAVINKHRNLFNHFYHYIDATAGCGCYGNGIIGSPLLFIEKAEIAGVKYKADLIEKNENSIIELERLIEERANIHSWLIKNIEYHNGRYEEIIPSLLIEKDTKELGLLFIDPTGNPPDFDTIALAAKQRPKMDILLYLATTNVKRLYHTKHMLLSEYMGKIDKNYWLIRKPIPGDTHKWTFLLGSNTNIFKDYRKIEFLRLDSTEAQKFFPSYNLSKKQLFQQLQPSLPTIFDEDNNGIE